MDCSHKKFKTTKRKESEHLNNLKDLSKSNIIWRIVREELKLISLHFQVMRKKSTKVSHNLIIIGIASELAS